MEDDFQLKWQHRQTISGSPLDKSLQLKKDLENLETQLMKAIIFFHQEEELNIYSNSAISYLLIIQISCLWIG